MCVGGSVRVLVSIHVTKLIYVSLDELYWKVTTLCIMSAVYPSLGQIVVRRTEWYTLVQKHQLVYLKAVINVYVFYEHVIRQVGIRWAQLLCLRDWFTPPPKVNFGTVLFSNLTHVHVLRTVFVESKLLITERNRLPLDDSADEFVAFATEYGWWDCGWWSFSNFNFD